MPNYSERLHYYYGQLLSVEDLTAEQDYFLEKRRLHNRLLHGWGVVEGLHVNPANTAWTVTVGPGYAIDRFGDEILVQSAQLATIPSHCRGKATHTLYVVIRYKETLTRPAPALAAGTDTIEYTRWRDDFEIALPEHPPDHNEAEASSQQNRTGAGIVLGSVTADSAGKITTHHCPLRRHLRRDS